LLVGLWATPIGAPQLKTSEIPKLPFRSEIYLEGYHFTFFPKIRLYGAISGEIRRFQWLVWRKYPDMADLLLCMAEKESGFNPNAIGDRGLAKGIYQIHTDKHPISDQCAFEPECALDYTAKLIKEGKGYLWTTYSLCQAYGHSAGSF